MTFGIFFWLGSIGRSARNRSDPSPPQNPFSPAIWAFPLLFPVQSTSPDKRQPGCPVSWSNTLKFSSKMSVSSSLDAENVAADAAWLAGPTAHQRQMSQDSDQTMVDGVTLTISPHREVHQTESPKEMDCSDSPLVTTFPGGLLHPTWTPKTAFPNAYQSVEPSRLSVKSPTKPQRRNAVDALKFVKKSNLTIRLRRQKCHVALKLSIPDLQENSPRKETQNSSSKAIGLENA